MKAWP